MQSEKSNLAFSLGELKPDVTCYNKRDTLKNPHCSIAKSVKHIGQRSLSLVMMTSSPVKKDEKIYSGTRNPK